MVADTLLLVLLLLLSFSHSPTHSLTHTLTRLTRLTPSHTNTLIVHIFYLSLAHLLTLFQQEDDETTFYGGKASGHSLRHSLPHSLIHHLTHQLPHPLTPLLTH